MSLPVGRSLLGAKSWLLTLQHFLLLGLNLSIYLSALGWLVAVILCLQIVNRYCNRSRNNRNLPGVSDLFVILQPPWILGLARSGAGVILAKVSCP